MDLFSTLVGQPQATALLTQVLSRERIAPAYLFVGPAGIGKRLAARQFAAALLAPKRGSSALEATKPDAANPEGDAETAELKFYPDLLCVEPTYLHKGQRLTAAEAELAGLKRRSPPLIRLEQVREITRFLSRPPLQAPRSVVVLDGAEAMAEAAANALLKTLEEPGNATLLLISHNRDLLLPTLISRCQSIPFQRLSYEAMTTVLAQLGEDALLQRPDLLALAQGSPGQAIAALQQWNNLPEELRLALAHLPTDLRQALTLARRVTTVLDVEAQLWVIDYLQHQDYSAHPASGEGWATAQRRLKILEQARQQLQRYVQPRLVWEVAFMSLAEALP
ncbi:MAG: AAA family ATPase [Elainellaceae cyanobacterium]